MKTGSIIIMVESLDASDKAALLELGFSSWPEPSDYPLEVLEVVNSDRLISGVGLTIDAFSELARYDVFLDVMLFREVLPPESVSIAEVIEFQQPVLAY